MDDTGKKAKVLFTQAHRELLSIGEDPGTRPETQGLCRLLVDQGFEPTPLADPLTFDYLQDACILVLGVPRDNLDSEVEIIRQFIEGGGGLLLVADSDAMINPVADLNELAKLAGLEFHEYLNYPPTWLQVFAPHYITANVDRVKVQNVAHIVCSDGARDLAFTRATHSTVVACGAFGQGRVVAVGDVGLFETDLLEEKGNETLIANIFRWLARQNAVDIQELVVPETVKWGQNVAVVLTLYNGQEEARPQVECVLESDADALISEPASKKRSIPPGKATQMQWTVKPQVLGDQKLRLTIHVDGQPSLYFDRLLPELNCEAPGYLTVHMQKASEQRAAFQTGDYFDVEGCLHWPAGLEPPLYQLELEPGEGLIKRAYQPGEGVSRWSLQAIAPGTHTLTLKVKETGQSLSAMVNVLSSIQDQLAELQAAYISPLDAEIAERLRVVDPRLSDDTVRRQPFHVLPLEDYIREVYDPQAANWLREVLDAARREQSYNLELLNNVIVYFAPAYLPGKGSFVPYDPSLASHLTRLHPTAKWRLEHNLLRSEESEDINVKQNSAACLLHEKYGHGFFYAHTRLGQQLAILQHHGFPDRPDAYKEYADTARVIKDSALIVNEGFAAWLELTFLSKLDREVRQAVYPRRISLLQEATDLYERQWGSCFFQAFPPRFDSPYREGFEYFDFIGRYFDLACVIRVFLMATNTELGISEDAEGHIQFDLESTRLEHGLLTTEGDRMCSYLRLRNICELIYEHREEIRMHVRECHCPPESGDDCPLEILVKKR